MARAERERTGTAGPEPRRRIPSVDALLRSEPGRRASGTFGRPLVKHALSVTLDQVRDAAERGTEPPGDDEILARALALASATAVGLVQVINATGVVLHTGLGRAPLPRRAADAAARAGQGYVDLEIDRESGARGRRSARAERLLASMTGAEDALVVNNGAAALLLALASLARGKGVLVSRGELIEIGGEFRIPDILAASGARLVEVGTTNRTRATDYRSALSDKTALILKVHPSNYRVVGFTSAPSAKDLAALARRAKVPFLYDLGSGLLDRAPGWVADEPNATDLVGRLRRHPIARAVRVDKMQVAALEAVLVQHAHGQAGDLPVWKMLREPPAKVRHRADELAMALDGDLEGAHVIACQSAVGGGALPGTGIPSFGVEVRAPDPNAMAARLRTGSPSVSCRVTERGILLDLRTVPRDALPDLVRAVRYALEGDDLPDD